MKNLLSISYAYVDKNKVPYSGNEFLVTGDPNAVAAKLREIFERFKNDKDYGIVPRSVVINTVSPRLIFDTEEMTVQMITNLISQYLHEFDTRNKVFRKEEFITYARSRLEDFFRDITPDPEIKMNTGKAVLDTSMEHHNMKLISKKVMP
jgi:hypothetical protein